jgi:hypothetical protein
MSGTMTQRKQLTAEECLRLIKPPAPARRFLQSWDSQQRELWFGLGTGDNAIIVSSARNLKRLDEPGDVPHSRLAPQTVEEFRSSSSPIEGARVVGQCRNFLRGHVHFSDERLYDLLSVWAIGTYVYSIFSHYGYLFFHSKLKRSGKTRIEEVLSHLCFEATSPLNAPTVPTIRDTAAEGRTLVLDTLERWKCKSAEAYAAAMEFLDAGFRNGAIVSKMEKGAEGAWKKVTMPVFAPYVLAGISRDSLADTALDRSFVIEMHRKSIAIKTQKYSFHRCEQECQGLRDGLYRWSLENAAGLADVYEGRDLEVEVDALELNDRAADIWKPLFAVVRVLGCNEVRKPLSSLAIEMSRDPEASERDRICGIVRSLRKLVNGNGAAAAMGTTSELLTHLQAEGLRIHERELHRMLEQWGFAQMKIRLQQGPRRAWKLQDSRLAEIESENSGPLYPLSKSDYSDYSESDRPDCL